MPCISAQYFLNDEIEIEEVKKQVGLLAEAGMDCILAHPRQGLRTPWMSRKWDEIIEALYETANGSGMQVAIWDKFPFPSGNAGGLVVAENPECAARHIEFINLPVRADQHIYTFYHDIEHLELGRLVGGYLMDAHGQLRDVTGDCGLTSDKLDMPRSICSWDYQEPTVLYGNPHFRWSNRYHRYALNLDHPEEYVGGHIVGVVEYRTPIYAYFIQNDLLSADSISKFVQKTHQYYYDIAAGKGMMPAFAFTDEPGSYGDYPWTPKFFAEFETDHGYDLQPLLPHIAVEIDDSSNRVRVDYRKTLGRLYAKNYLGTISDWCKAHNIPLGGHLPGLAMVGECTNVPYKFRAHEYMDIPTYDPIEVHTSNRDTVIKTLGLRFAASASGLFGKRYTMTDSFAVLPESASLRELKNAADWHMFAGVNCFSMHNFSYSIAGPRKDKAPPSYFYQQPWFGDFRNLTDYVKQVCRHITDAHRFADTLVLLPDTTVNVNSIESPEVYAHRLTITEKYTDLGEKLLKSHAMFEFIDEQGIVEAAIQAGHFELHNQFQCVILPNLEYIEPATAEKLGAASTCRYDRRVH